jgi:hypothetical protein
MNAIMIYCSNTWYWTTIYIIKRSWVLKQDPGDEKNERDFRLYLKGLAKQNVCFLFCNGASIVLAAMFIFLPQTY